MDETQIIDAWLYATLTGDQALGALLGAGANVFPELAAEGTTGAYITYSVSPTGDTTAMGMSRSFAGYTYLVTAWSQDGGYQAVQSILGRVDALINAQAVTGEAMVFKVRRQSGTQKLPSFADDVRYQRAMASYAVTAQPIG